MSILKSKQLPSKAEYVNTANLSDVETINFLTRLSSRYARMMAERPARMAAEVMEHAEKANKIYPSDEQRKALRKAHLLEAQASLSALDTHLTHCYMAMIHNPQGCFTNAKGKTLSTSEADERLDKMAQSLGELIEREETLLKGLLASDRKR